MATTAVAKSKLADRLARLQASAATMREAAKVAAQRTTVFVFSAAGGGAVGYVDGWAERTGKKLTIGTSRLRIPLLASVGMGLAGALGYKAIGPEFADVALGLGSGGTAGELALAGRKMALTPPAPAPGG
jgi:hypothetical protein